MSDFLKLTSNKPPEVETENPTEATTAKSPILERIYQKVKLRLNFFQKSEIKLEGRIKELQENADDFLLKLTFLRKHFQSQIDEELFSFVASVLDPMAKDMRRIQKLMEQKDSKDAHSEAIKKYQEWLEKAHIWVQLGDQENDRDAIIQAIMKHAFIENQTRINQDLQVLRDYEITILESLPLGTEEKTKLERLLRKELEPRIAALHRLKHQLEMPVEHLSIWRQSVDASRERHFELALQAIDNLIKEWAPAPHNKAEDHDHN